MLKFFFIYTPDVKAIKMDCSQQVLLMTFSFLFAIETAYNV